MIHLRLAGRRTDAGLAPGCRHGFCSTIFASCQSIVCGPVRVDHISLTCGSEWLSCTTTACRTCLCSRPTGRILHRIHSGGSQLPERNPCRHPDAHRLDRRRRRSPEIAVDRLVHRQRDLRSPWLPEERRQATHGAAAVPGAPQEACHPRRNVQQIERPLSPCLRGGERWLRGVPPKVNATLWPSSARQHMWNLNSRAPRSILNAERHHMRPVHQRIQKMCVQAAEAAYLRPHIRQLDPRPLHTLGSQAL